MKSLDKIPVSKVERATKLVKTGVRIGGNYMKYYGDKILNPETAKDKLNENNAEDIYDSLKSLKGSALKMAQMLSMEKNLLPRAYVEKFSLSQFSVPPLSAPLVRKTFKKYLGKYPEELFDSFEKDSINAASIGQVHRAEKDGKKLAVKIQYPGVAESIGSDLALVKPIAVKMFNLKGKDAGKFFKEVEDKLNEETNYILELKQSEQITTACAKLPGLKFPEYYESLSNERIITMDWMDGMHLSEFVAKPFTKETGDRIGQVLWDFYMYQIHGLKKVHADPHPGNFMINDKQELIVIDFGCIKEIPENFHNSYFALTTPEAFSDEERLLYHMEQLEILRAEDTPEEFAFFKELFTEMLQLFTSPFHGETFDFGADDFWNTIAGLSERYANDPKIRKMNGNRGSRHFLYINRTFFGLYNLLHDLKATIQVNHYKQYL